MVRLQQRGYCWLCCLVCILCCMAKAKGASQKIRDDDEGTEVGGYIRKKEGSEDWIHSLVRMHLLYNMIQCRR